MANVGELERLDSCSKEMELSRTAKKLKTEEIDRISTMPDDVVSLILSFLTTKEAVATSILSKRWRPVWTLAPDLEYDGRWSKWSKTEGFLRFFWDSVKPLNKSFGLVRLRGSFNGRLGDLVMEIMARKVRELDVGDSSGACAKFNCSLLSSETLVSLKLHSFSFPLELSVHLPRLKILHLDCMVSISDRSIQEFISGCPLLEDFLLHEYEGHGSLESLPILFTSQTLVSLKLSYGILFHVPSPVHLPCLKILHLEINKEEVKPEGICQLLSGCPLLENFQAEYNRGLGHTHVPYNLFVLKSLGSLKLKGMISFDVPFPVHLPCLKIFRLESAWTMHDEFLGNLLGGCPLLEDVYIRCFGSKPIHIPHNLFISKTLVSLELHGRFSFHVSSSAHLPCLRVLRLGNDPTMHAEFLHNLLSGCPVLEIMHLRDAGPKWSENLSICIPTLKCLKLDLLSSYPTGYKHEIIAPALKELRVHFQRCFNGETAWNFPNLEKASVGCRRQTPIDLLGTVQNTKVLELRCGGRGSGRLPEDMKLIPKFQYLEVLVIRDSVIFAHYLPEILENSPNLKKLIIDRKHYDREISWSPPPLVPHCLLHTLEAFSITDFRGLDGEMQMMNYILSSARMLEEVKIKIPVMCEMVRVQEELSAVPRCSSTCRLQFI